MIDIQHHTLSNGLKVIVHHDPATVMVVVDVLYNTGSRDESRNLTGIAHLFEHLMFSGSVNVPHFDQELENAGGSSNAWTSNDFTNFYDILPAENIETALRLESDRMLQLAFSETALKVQQSVVIEEFKQQCLNRPFGDLMHGLRAALYCAEHPYSWPVIGLEPSHIENVTNEDVRTWFFSHYAPNNAVLVIAGNCPCPHAIELAEKWFGDIPRRPISPRRLPPPGFPTHNRVVEMQGNVPYPSLTIAIPMSHYGTKEYRAADAISDILSVGKSARLLRKLVIEGDGTIIEADASIIGSEEPGAFLMSARIKSTEDFDKVRDMLREQLFNLTKPGNLTDDELQRTFNQFETTFMMQNIDLVARATNIALAAMHREDINNTVALQRRLTIDDIRQTAQQLHSAPYVAIKYSPTD